VLDVGKQGSQRRTVFLLHLHAVDLLLQPIEPTPFDRGADGEPEPFLGLLGERIDAFLLGRLRVTGLR